MSSLDNDELVFADEGNDSVPQSLEYWKILIVDDEIEIHDVTRLALNDFTFDNKTLQFLSAYSGKDACQMVVEHPDIAVVLLDVIMESDNAGLLAAKYIRETIQNQAVRIVLRTGQPGQVPERQAIVDYDIDDYKAKTEFTAQKLFTTIITALRSYKAYKALADYNRTLELKVKQRTSELQAIIDNMADGLAVVDREGKVTHLNPALTCMLKLPSECIQDAYFHDVLMPPIGELVSSTSNLPGEVCTVEVDLPENRIGKAVGTSIFRHDPDSSEIVYSGSVILLRDITTEKEVDRMKTDFVSSVSHELRTPLTSVLGFTKLIQKKLEETIFPHVSTSDQKVNRVVRQVSENIEIIVSEGMRLTKLINEVLDIAKMEAGKMDWHMEPITISEVIDRALQATSSLCVAKGLQIVAEVAEGLPEISADKDRLIQVAINLISNAVKFQDKGVVTCRAELTGDEITVSVIDQGIGIAKADIPKVFEKFKQVGDLLSNKPQGTGLGLPISKEIVEHHGGRMWVKSELEQGTTFCFTIPLSTAKTEGTKEPPSDRSPFLAANL